MAWLERYSKRTEMVVGGKQKEIHIPKHQLECERICGSHKVAAKAEERKKTKQGKALFIMEFSANVRK